MMMMMAKPKTTSSSVTAFKGGNYSKGFEQGLIFYLVLVQLISSSRK
jgi:hypothetical protein